MTIGAIAGLAAGVGLAGAGFWLLWGRRLLGSGGDLTSPTRAVFGIILLVAGYHAAAYSGPAAWFPLKLPVAMLPIAGVVAALAVVGSLVADRIERTP